MTPPNIDEILSSTSEYLFPEEDGKTPVLVETRGSNGDTALHVVLWQHRFDCALVLLEAGADPNASGDMGETPFHIAAKAAPRWVLARFLDAGADADVLSEFGNSPRDIAVARESSLAELFKE